MSVILCSGGSGEEEGRGVGAHAVPKSARRAGPLGVEMRMLVGLMSRWIMFLSCRWDRPAKMFLMVFVCCFHVKGSFFKRREERSSGWNGKTSRRDDGVVGRVCVERRGMIFGCLREARMRASRLESWGGWDWEGVVSLSARVWGGLVVRVL